jgi:hypothetical protein
VLAAIADKVEDVDTYSVGQWDLLIYDNTPTGAPDLALVAETLRLKLSTNPPRSNSGRSFGVISVIRDPWLIYDIGGRTRWWRINRSGASLRRRTSSGARPLQPCGTRSNAKSKITSRPTRRGLYQSSRQLPDVAWIGAILKLAAACAHLLLEFFTQSTTSATPIMQPTGSRGAWHWLLPKARSIRQVDCTGRLGLWTPSATVIKKLPAWVGKLDHK